MPSKPSRFIPSRPLSAGHQSAAEGDGRSRRGQRGSPERVCLHRLLPCRFSVHRPVRDSAAGRRAALGAAVPPGRCGAAGSRQRAPPPRERAGSRRRRRRHFAGAAGGGRGEPAGRARRRPGPGRPSAAGPCPGGRAAPPRRGEQPPVPAGLRGTSSAPPQPVRCDTLVWRGQRRDGTGMSYPGMSYPGRGTFLENSLKSAVQWDVRRQKTALPQRPERMPCAQRGDGPPPAEVMSVPAEADLRAFLCILKCQTRDARFK